MPIKLIINTCVFYRSDTVSEMPTTSQRPSDGLPKDNLEPQVEQQQAHAIILEMILDHLSTSRLYGGHGWMSMLCLLLVPRSMPIEQKWSLSWVRKFWVCLFVWFKQQDFIFWQQIIAFFNWKIIHQIYDKCNFTNRSNCLQTEGDWQCAVWSYGAIAMITCSNM